MTQGQRIRQVREYLAMTQDVLADRLKVTQPAVAQIEANLMPVSEDMLQRLVAETGFPKTFFLRQLESPFPLGSLVMRAHSELSAKDKARAHRAAELVFHLAGELSKGLTQIPIGIPRLAEDPTTAARMTRSALGLAPDTPIDNLFHALELRGVLILVLPIEFDLMDAFSTWTGTEKQRPVIAVSKGKSGDRLRFSVAHELGHLVLHFPPRGTVKDIESEAHQFAAEFLMPESAMVQEITRPVTLTSIAPLKSRWKVSIQALIKRAYDLEIITQRQYRYLFQQLSSRGWRTQEPRPIGEERPRALLKMAEVANSNRLDFHRMAERADLPVDFVRSVLSSYAEHVVRKESGKVVALKPR